MAASADLDPWLTLKSPPSFIYVKIPVVDGLEGDDRSLDEAIDQALVDRRLGSVLSWGASLGERNANGVRPLAFHRIDVQVSALDAARALLHEILPALGIPAATELHYAGDGKHRLDVYDGAAWRLALVAPSPGTQ